MLTYLQAIIIGALQGVTELFPVSSLAHSVIVPALIGGSWRHLVTESSAGSSGSSPYLAFIVAVHVATALALLTFFRDEWVRIIGAFFTSIRERRASTPDQRLAWLIVIATIPAGLTGLLFEHTFRTLFAKPLSAAAFLTCNGLILLAGERLRRRAEARVHVGAARSPGDHREPGRDLSTLAYREAGIVGLFQTLALFAGISRSGITMVAGLLRGLNHEDAARFSFLLATPIIFAAGLLKLPQLFGPSAAHIHGQVIAGALTAGIAAYLSVRFLTRYFTTRTLMPFAIYSLVAGALCVVRFATD